MPDGVLAFIIAFAGTIILTPIVRWLCIRFSLNADPNPIIQTHKIPTPTLGGVGIYISFLAALAIVMIPAGQAIYFWKLVLGTVPIFFMGIYDDLKGLSFKFKGLAEIILVIVFILVFRLRPGFEIHPVIDYFLMILWFVGIINAINLIDIMDGLAPGIGLFGSLGFFILAAVTGKHDLIPIAAALSGCYIAFLYYNFNPAKIFLGDNGSLILGISMAYLGFELVGHEPLSPRAMAPVIILAVPIFEVILLILRRLKKKIPIFHGSPDHLALIIQSFGNPIPKTAVIIYLISACLLILGIWVGTSTLAVQISVSSLLLILAVFLMRFMVRVNIAK